MIEALRQGRSSTTLELENIAVEARTSESFARAALARFAALAENGSFSVDSKARVELALEIARAGQLKEAAQSLRWQEFETFGGECLLEAGFRVEKNIRVRGDGRAWQIDLVGFRGDLILAIDCKHWNTSGYESRLQPPANHQSVATTHFMRTLRTKPTDQGGNLLQGLAVILTLLEPPVRFLEKCALVSVERLPGFLNAVTPYDRSLPLLSISDLQSKTL